jgi:hypothetical protein
VCAKHLKSPKEKAVPADPEDDDPKTVPLLQAEETVCGWTTRAGLAKSADWRVAVRANDVAPTGRCDMAAGDEESAQGE